MKSINWKDIFEFFGVAAIVASLLFVGLQLQQDRRLTRAELGSASLQFRAAIAVGLATSDSDISDVWVKMLDHPQDLSMAEMVKINGVLESARDMMLRECYLKAMEVFGECESLVGGVARVYFSNDYAQAWWRHTHSLNPFGTADVINEIVTSVDTSGNRSLLEKIKSGL